MFYMCTIYLYININNIFVYLNLFDCKLSDINIINNINILL